MKLAFFPMVAFALFQCKWFGDRQDYWKTKCLGTLITLVLIPVLFYTLKGVVGNLPEWVNIVEFFVVLLIAYWWEYKQFTKPDSQTKSGFYLVILLAVALLFAIFTFCPPKWAIFVDPITLGRGIVQ